MSAHEFSDDRDDLPFMVHSELDDLDLTPYEFRAYTHIVRRAHKSRTGTTWESLVNGAKHCNMALSSYRTAIASLVEKGLLSRKDRVGQSPILAANPMRLWKVQPRPKTLSDRTPTKTDTPIKSDMGTPIRSDSPPLSEVIDEGNQVSDSIEGNQNKQSSASELSASEPQAGLVPQAARANRSITKDEAESFLSAWNDNRGQLPACQVLTEKRRKGIARFLKDVPGDADGLALFRAAVQEVARDSFWIERKYGLDNLLVQGRVVEKAEKHMAGPRADRKVVEAVQRASSFADRIRARRANQS